MDDYETESAADVFARLQGTPIFGTVEENCFQTLSPNDVIEIYGSSGSGKTELLYHFTVRCICPQSWKGLHLNGLNTEVMFIDNDCHFDLLRLVTILEKRIKTLRAINQAISISSKDIAVFVNERLKLLHIMKCYNSDNFIVTLCSFENLLQLRKTNTLVMIDGITSFYWADRMRVANKLKKLQEHHDKIIDVMKKLSVKCNLPIFATKRKILRDAESNDKILGQSWRDMVTYQLDLQANGCNENQSLVSLCISSKEGKVTKNCAISDTGFSFL